MNQRALAFGLLLVGVMAQVGWRYVPVEWQADVWNANGATLRIFLLSVIAAAFRGWRVWCACGLLAAFDAATAVCSIAYIAHPWVMQPGDARCSSALDAPIGVVGMWLAFVLVIEIALSNKKEGVNHGSARQ